MKPESNVTNPTFPYVYAAKNRSDVVRSRSSSGGVFHALASHIIDRGGIVYGCAFNDKLEACHIRCDTIEQCESCMGSKYSQSSMGNTIQDIKRDLETGRLVLFVGTPCQADAVRATCGCAVLTVDFVCHGVPSPGIFQEHVRFLEAKTGDVITGYEHRPKNKGWGHCELFRTNGGVAYQGVRLSESWRRLFYSNLVLRPSCYECRYAMTERFSDITIADYWGIEHTEIADFRDELGVSLIIANTVRGHDVVRECDVTLLSSQIEDALPGNPMLSHPSTYSGDREAIWKSLYHNGYESTLRSYRFFPSVVRYAASIARDAMRQANKRR